MQFRLLHLQRKLIGAALALAVAAHASVIVQLKVVEGEGAVYRAGTRATRGMTVLVTDETGKPVANAAVSFRLPDQGPSGAFNSGLRSEVVTTGPNGLASVWGMQWNKEAGSVEIRITAVKDQARAGIVSAVQLSDAAAPASGGQGVFEVHKGHGKLFLLCAILGGGAAAGAMMGMSHSTSASSAAAPSGLSIGTPSIIVGHQ